MKKWLKISLMSLVSVLAIAGISIGGLVLNSVTYKVGDIPATHTNNTDLIQAYGKGLYEANGNEIVLKGTNIGACFVTEGWLVPYCIEDPTYNEKGEPQYKEISEDQFLNALKNNPNNFTTKDIEDIQDTYYNAWICEEDFKNISDLGMNCIRLPFGYKMILNEDLSRKDETKAFKYLDKVIEWSKKYNLYVVLDLHCAPGSQNGYEHGGSVEYASGTAGAKYVGFWNNETYVNAVCDLWKYVSEHYSTTRSDLASSIAMYDILNEPRSSKASTDKECWDVMDKIYDTIRDSNDKHVVTLEGCWTFACLPDPTDYGWENVCYSHHWYNFQQFNWTLFYAYEDAFNIGRDYNVPYYQGEFNFFDNEEDWAIGLKLFDERHYSWTNWTYKKVVAGWWNDSWSIYNLNMYENDTNIIKVNVAKATKQEILDALSVENLNTKDNAKTSSTYDILKKYFEGKLY